MITYKKISISDPDYIDEKALRNEVLRLPLGLQLNDRDTFDEINQLHIIAKDENRVIGCILVILEPSRARLRQMAVETKYRGLEIGSHLVISAEQIIKNINIHNIYLHARVDALGFYEKLGYQRNSDIFTEVTIPHVKMDKNLS
jgi:N-acetylglutamate synthase-like GNAT family acetyltransferase